MTLHLFFRWFVNKVKLIMSFNLTTEFSPTQLSNVTEGTKLNAEIGAVQVVELIYLTILCVLGSVGNLVVIFSITLENRVHSHGNIFVINLAIADLLVTGFVVPTVMINVIQSANALPPIACTIVGYTVTVTCTCSLSNLTVIAINRFWAVVRSKTYTQNFTRKRVYLMMIATWVWSNLLSMPSLIGWGRIGYDEKIMVCSWDDTYSRSFTIFITVGAIVLPVIVIALCYWKLFMTVRSSGRWVRSLSMGNSAFQSNEQHRRSVRKERNLLQTLATTVAFFCVCWLPYGLCVLIDPVGVPPLAKKACGWLGLSNSAVNFVIYGAMNPVFRRGYRNLFILVFRCKRPNRITSTALHGSQSDTFYKSRKKSIPTTPTPNSGNKFQTRWSSPGAIIHTAKQNSAAEMNQERDSSRRHCKVWSTNVTPWSKFLDSRTESPKHQKQQPETPEHKNTPTLSKIEKAISPAHLFSFKRSETGSVRKVDKIRNEAAIWEARKKRNSLMLLQIELSDDDDSPINKRRTKSEIPYGVTKPCIRRNPSTRTTNSPILPLNNNINHDSAHEMQNNISSKQQEAVLEETKSAMQDSDDDTVMITSSVI
nr:dopamine D2-like receptor isoform X1 [Ciona intestinalis]|eukprot:XP_018667208.2 dopamine D2-like receptor isoform X1 [Ciona intestinalis]